MHPTLPCTLPDGIHAFQFEEVREALDGADLVICGVSSFGVDWFAAEALPLLPCGAPVLNVTKGLLGYPDGSLETFPHFFDRKRPDLAFASIGGPCASYELGERRQTLVCYCSENLATAKFARDLLKTSYSSRVENSLISGAHDGKLHFNPQAALFAQSCIEMRRLVRLLGGNGDLAGGVPGAGDLYLTIFGGRTRRLGTLLGRGLSHMEVRKRLAGVTLEAVSVITPVAEALRMRAKRKEVSLQKFPLLMHLDARLTRKSPWPWTGTVSAKAACRTAEGKQKLPMYATGERKFLFHSFSLRPSEQQSGATHAGENGCDSAEVLQQGIDGESKESALLQQNGVFHGERGKRSKAAEESHR